MNSPIPAPPKASTNPLKAIIKFLVKIFLFVLKPLGRVFWFIFEWPIKLAPILIIGGYSAALWEVDNAFLASAKKTRLSQTYAKTYDYFSSHVLVMDQKYNAITEQEAVARATMDRAQLVKEQFRFTVSALGNEIASMFTNPFSYPYSQFGKKALAIYDHVQFMPAEGIEAIIDGNWYTELDFEDDFKNKDHLDNNYVKLETKKVDLSKQTLYLGLFGSDYRETAAGTKNKKDNTDDEQSEEEQPPPLPNKEKQEQCRTRARNKVEEKEAKIKKEAPSLNQNDWYLDLEKTELDEYYQCLGKK